MTPMIRLAVYYAPRPGAFASCAASWLGWDPASGRSPQPPDMPGLPASPAELTAEPRRYGFHGTLRAPFRPAGGLDAAEVAAEVAQIAARLAPVRCDRLRLAVLDGFLALLPEGNENGLQALAAAVTEATDRLRAPLTEAETARRRPERLTPRQAELLTRWGYPYVMEEFRFHLTLTGRLDDDRAHAVAAILGPHLAPVLPQPFVIEDLCLFGEDGDGRFHLVSRHALCG